MGESFYNQFEDSSHLRISILLKIFKMASKITLAFFAVLISGAYSAPSAPPVPETSEDQSIKSETEAKNVTSKCHVGTTTEDKLKNETIETFLKLELIPCLPGSCFVRKIEGNYTFGCTTKREEIENGKCKVFNSNNVNITECHCHEDSECDILPLMEKLDKNLTITPVETTFEPEPEVEPEVEHKGNKTTPEHGRHYDGLSFFGGILLTVTVSVIGFFVYRKYHPRGIESQRLFN